MRKSLLLTATLSLGLLPIMSANADSQEPPTIPAEEISAFEKMFGKGPQEEDFYRADRLLVSATGSLKPVRLAPSVASVITSDDIKAIGATTLDEVLETVPGLHVEPSGTAFFGSIWSIRGIHTPSNPHVLLLVNSVPFTMTYVGGRPYTFNMPVAMISRVEVIRGPGSALHGADAFAGTINVITKDNHEIDGNRMGARYGSFNSSDAWLQHGGIYGGWELALGLEWKKTSGDKDRTIDKDYLHAFNLGALSNAPGTIDTSSELLDSHLNLRKDNWSLHLYSNIQESAMGLGSLQAITDNDEDAVNLLAVLNYENKDLLKDWLLNSRLSYSYIHSDDFLQLLPPAYVNMVGNPIHENKDGGIELTGLYSGFPSHQLRLGAGWKNFEYEPDQYKNFGPAAGPPANWYGNVVHVTDQNHIFTADANRQLLFGLIQDEWAFARGWELTAGLRYDEYSDFGSTKNPRVALVWETMYNLTTKLMYGQAFRAPSFGEQGVKNNPQVIGNPDLTPEEIETLELSFDYQPTTNLRMMINGYTYEANDLIELTGALPQPYTNLTKQEGQGIEIVMDWQVFENFNLQANYSQQRSRNVDTDSLTPDAPGRQLYLNPHWDFQDNWSLDGQYTWVGERHRAKDDPRSDIKDYELVNLTLRRENIAKNWEAAVSVRNLFDENGRIPSPYAPGVSGGAYVPNDYPIEGRAIWAEISMHY